MRKGDSIRVLFPDKTTTGTIKVATSHMIVVEDAPGFSFILRFDANMGKWFCGKTAVMFEACPEARLAYFRAKLAEISELAGAL